MCATATALKTDDTTVTSASVALGARVSGIDLSHDQGDDTIGLLKRLLQEHHLIVLSEQDFSAIELRDFGLRWGELLTHPATKHRDTEYVQWIASNGRKIQIHPSVFSLSSGWHSDMTWHSTPPFYTGLHARQLPSKGGDTMFANQHMAYDTLDEETKERLEGLEAFHTGKVFGPDVEDSIHPVIRTHEDTGRKALFVNVNFTRYIVGMPDDENKDLLTRLFYHSSRPEFTYRHQWEVGDLVLWDNRSVMHYAIADYDERRVMHRIVVKGSKPT